MFVREYWALSSSKRLLRGDIESLQEEVSSLKSKLSECVFVCMYAGVLIT